MFVVFILANVDVCLYAMTIFQSAFSMPRSLRFCFFIIIISDSIS